MTYIGIIEAFTGNDFEAYQERLEAYFEANDIGGVNEDATESEKKAADRKMVAHAITVMDRETYDTLKDCCLPEKPMEKMLVVAKAY